MLVGVTGPTHIRNLVAFLDGIAEKDVLQMADITGRICAELGVTIRTNADGGVPYEVGLAFKRAGGRGWEVVYPEFISSSSDWPQGHTLPYLTGGDVLIRAKDWDEANRLVIRGPDATICVGESPAGVPHEIAKLCYDVQFGMSTLKRFIVVRPLWVEGRLPRMQEVRLRDILVYVETPEEIRQILADIQ